MVGEFVGVSVGGVGNDTERNYNWPWVLFICKVPPIKQAPVMNGMP